jgi:hypothetical protein
VYVARSLFVEFDARRLILRALSLMSCPHEIIKHPSRMSCRMHERNTHHTHAHIHTRTHTRTHTHTHTHEHTHTCMHACMHHEACMHICVSAHQAVCTNCQWQLSARRVVAGPGALALVLASEGPDVTVTNSKPHPYQACKKTMPRCQYFKLH